jgi:hypothetical protein
MTDLAERRARNEALFREANERLEDAALAAPTDVARFLCECSDASCDQSIPVPIEAYEAVRAVPTRFLVAPGHVDAAIEHVVETHDEYVVVQKHGASAVVAIESDPRE